MSNEVSETAAQKALNVALTSTASHGVMAVGSVVGAAALLWIGTSLLTMKETQADMRRDFAVMAERLESLKPSLRTNVTEMDTWLKSQLDKLERRVETMEERRRSDAAPQ